MLSFFFYLMNVTDINEETDIEEINSKALKETKKNTLQFQYTIKLLLLSPRSPPKHIEFKRKQGVWSSAYSIQYLKYLISPRNFICEETHISYTVKNLICR